MSIEEHKERKDDEIQENNETIDSPKEETENHEESSEEANIEEKVKKEKKEEEPEQEKKHSWHRQKDSNLAWIGAAVILGFLLILSLFTNGFTDFFKDDITGSAVMGSDDITGSSVIGSDDKANLEFYVMSQCPYGTQVVDAIAPVIEQMGDSIDFRLEFIMYPPAQYAGQEDKMCLDDMCAMHGLSEANGNIVQLCAQKYEPDNFMDMVVCMNKNAGSIPGNWESCAEEAGLDTSNIKSCYEGDEGKQLLKESSDKAKSLGAQGSPTIFLNGEQYSGGRQTNEFMRSICNSFTDRPSVCDDIPEPVKVEMILLNDKRCGKDCEVSGLTSQLKSIFPGLTTTTLDYSSTEGKKLFEESNISKLPAFLFTDSVEQGEGYANVQQYLESKGEYRSLMIEANFDPTKEICDNGIDDTGNNKVDCDDESCKNSMECRQEIEGNLDVFVMSQCPYGMKALDAMKEVIENFDGIKFGIYYIARENADGTFNSLHGQPEVDENIRELCAIEHYPDDHQYMDYIWCRNKNMKGDWETCAEEAGIDADVIKTCFEGDEGINLHSENIKLGQALNIGASPTWLANNKNTFPGIDAETIKSNFCKYNEGMEGCENTLTADAGEVSGSCG